MKEKYWYVSRCVTFLLVKLIDIFWQILPSDQDDYCGNDGSEKYESSKNAKGNDTTCFKFIKKWLNAMMMQQKNRTILVEIRKKDLHLGHKYYDYYQGLIAAAGFPDCSGLRVARPPLDLGWLGHWHQGFRCWLDNVQRCPLLLLVEELLVEMMRMLAVPQCLQLDPVNVIGFSLQWLDNRILPIFSRRGVWGTAGILRKGFVLSLIIGNPLVGARGGLMDEGETLSSLLVMSSNLSNGSSRSLLRHEGVLPFHDPSSVHTNFGLPTRTYLGDVQ